MIVALLLLLLSYLIYGQAILSKPVCHVCFSFHHHPYQMVHPRTPSRFCSLHAYCKIHSIAFILMVWSAGWCFLLCWLLYGWGLCISWLHSRWYTSPPLNPKWLHPPIIQFQPAKSTNMELCLLWDHSMYSWPIQPSLIAYWYHVRKFCKWNGLNPPKTTRLSHHSDVRRLRNPPFRALRERAIYPA